MRTIANKTTALAATLMLFACNRPADPTVTTDIMIGEWEKLEKTMPPVNLVISRNGDGDHARLRLSGVEQFGTVTTNGNHIVLHFANTVDMAGEIVSKTELKLDLTPSVRIRLWKRSPQVSYAQPRPGRGSADGGNMLFKRM